MAEPSAAWPSSAGDDGGGGVQDALAEGPLDDQEGEDDLQAEAPGDGAPADGAAVGGEGVGDAEKDKKAKQSGKPCQMSVSNAVGWMICIGKV